MDRKSQTAASPITRTIATQERIAREFRITRRRSELRFLKASQFDLVGVEKVAQAICGAEQAITVPLYDSLRGIGRGAWVWMNATAEKEYDDEALWT